jgi:hypothetical protein
LIRLTTLRECFIGKSGTAYQVAPGADRLRVVVVVPSLAS